MARVGVFGVHHPSVERTRGANHPDRPSGAIGQRTADIRRRPVDAADWGLPAVIVRIG